MTTTEQSTVTLPTDLMHRLLDNLESQAKEKTSERRTHRLELAVTGLCVLGIIVEAFVVDPLVGRKAWHGV